MKKTFKILIVEDDVIDARFIENVVVSAGFDAQIAHSSENALTALSQTTYDLVLVDLKMIDMSGIQILALIKRYYPSTEVIIITAHASIDTAVESIRMGAHSYFIKGEPTRKLLDEIKTIAGKQDATDSDRFSNSQSGLARLRTRGTTFSNTLSQAEVLATTGMNTLITGAHGTGKKVLAQHMSRYNRHKSASVYEIDFCPTTGNLPLQASAAIYGLSNFLKKNERNGVCLFVNIDHAEPATLNELLAVLNKQLPKHQTKKQSVSVISTCSVQSASSLNTTYGAANFFRYWGIKLELPEIAERREDIPLIIEHILNNLCSKHNAAEMTIDAKLLHYLSESFFVGEFAGLEKLVERLFEAASGKKLTLELMEHIKTDDILLLQKHPFSPGEPSSLKDAREQSERTFINTIYNRCGRNKTRAAAALGISSRQLYNMLKKYHLEKV
ncbi:response regulator [Halodesulfovibrio sp.]|jgi:DNA-binding NtrC family response regulator|uniref:sigma-54-dependent transcriptional regulator n=1 Tax=Halodesulfovibrio sp. TaxID=1912772 RepID=UPI0025EF4B31|nr:response regulator [Halodesulfovibrio sp.]MCT4627435.1 response regulator [Halodesulfovibrio sp.]